MGEKLYQFALDYAKELGYTRHFTWNDNEGAVRFYERLENRDTEMETILKIIRFHERNLTYEE